MLKKQYLDDKKTCKVTFSIGHDATEDVKVVSLVGDFNDWDAEADPMKRGKSGDFSTTGWESESGFVVSKGSSF